MTEEVEDESWVMDEQRDALPPDMFWFDGCLRPWLGMRTLQELTDLSRQHWLSRDDEHQRFVWARRHEVPHAFEDVIENLASDFDEL